MVKQTMRTYCSCSFFIIYFESDFNPRLKPKILSLLFFHYDAIMALQIINYSTLVVTVSWRDVSKIFKRTALVSYHLHKKNIKMMDYLAQNM